MHGNQPFDLDVNEVFSYVALAPNETGLPVVVWVPDPTAKDPCLRVQIEHTREAQPNRVALVTISENPSAIDGEELQEADWKAAEAFIKSNYRALHAHLKGHIDTIELGQQLVKVGTR